MRTQILKLVQRQRMAILIAASVTVAVGLLVSKASAQLSPANDVTWAHSVNLLPLVDPTTDATAGTWAFDGGNLVSLENKNAIQIPFQPPEEYDFRIVFSRKSGNENVTQIFSQQGRQADWVMDGWGQRIFGFERVAGKNADANNTTVHAPRGFENGQSYTSILQVRKTGVQALLDGKLISQWMTDFSDATVHDILVLPNHQALGLSTRSPTIFSKIDLLERTGKGKTIAHASDANSSKPAGTLSGGGSLVKSYRNSLVFVNGTTGAGSGFIATLPGGNFLITNAHVAAGVRDAAFKTLDGAAVQGGAASVAVGHDIFRMQVGSIGKPFEIMQGVDENAAIDDEIAVLGNAEGAGVINAIKGRIVGIGPNLVEVDAPFVPGNSGSPIIHLNSGKVIGVATYLIIKKYDAATKAAVKEPIVRRFGYRLDSVKAWQTVNWQSFYAQAAEMQRVETLTEALDNLLRDLAKNNHITVGAHPHPVIKARIDAWISDRSHRLSPKDLASVNQNFVSFLKIACQTDVAAARQHLSFDYFQRSLAEQQRARNEIAEVFDKIIKDIQTER